MFRRIRDAGGDPSRTKQGPADINLGKKFHRVERYYGSFTRNFTLPDNVDETKIKASFKEGMLDLQIPKTAEAKAKTIEVKVD